MLDKSFKVGKPALHENRRKPCKGVEAEESTSRVRVKLGELLFSLSEQVDIFRFYAVGEEVDHGKEIIESIG